MDKLAVVKTIGIGALVAVLLFIPSTNNAEKQFVIKIATLAPEGSSWMKAFNALKTDVMKKTDKRVKFKIYPGGVLGDEKDMLRKMYIGQIHGAALTASGLSVLFNEIDVFQIPFLFQTFEEVDHVVAKTDTFFRKGFEDNGYILLSWSEAGFVYLMSTVPVSTVDDLKKVKVWIWEESPIAEAIFDEAEIAAIPLSVPDVLVGLQTGLVEVVYAPPTGAILLQWFTKVRYMTDVPLIYLIGGIVLRKDVFERMPQAFRDTVMEAFQSHMDPLKTVIRNENQEAIVVMTKHGVKIITPSKNQIDEFKRLSDKAMQRLVDRAFSGKVMDEVSSYLKECRGVTK